MLGGDGGIVMLKAAFVVLAVLSLSACATVAPMHALDAAAPASAAGHGEPDALTELVVVDCAIEAPQVEAAIATPALSRRAFGSPTRRQPDLHLVLATAADRGRFRRARRRTVRRIAPIRRTLLTS
jgi:hypothetical protein